MENADIQRIEALLDQAELQQALNQIDGILNQNPTDGDALVIKGRTGGWWRSPKPSSLWIKPWHTSG